MSNQAQTIVSDPVVAILDAAPVVEATAEELEAFELGLSEVRAGQSIPAEFVQQRLAARTSEE